MRSSASEGISRQSAKSLGTYSPSSSRPIVDAFHDHGSLPSPAHQGLIDRDLNQPGAEASLGAELPDVGKGLQHGLLGRVFRVGFVAQNGQRRRINPAFVRPDQLVEQVVLATLHARDQILLVRAACLPRVV